MTDEERKKLCEDLRGFNPWPSKPVITDRAADEIERLQRQLDSTLGLLYQESERRAKAEHDLKCWQEVGWSRVKATPSSHS